MSACEYLTGWQARKACIRMFPSIFLIFAKNHDGSVASQDPHFSSFSPKTTMAQSQARIRTRSLDHTGQSGLYQGSL